MKEHEYFNRLFATYGKLTPAKVNLINMQEMYGGTFFFTLLLMLGIAIFRKLPKYVIFVLICMSLIR